MIQRFVHFLENIRIAEYYNPPCNQTCSQHQEHLAGKIFLFHRLKKEFYSEIEVKYTIVIVAVIVEAALVV